MSKTFSCSVFLALVIVLLTVQVAVAQETTPRWRSGLDCNPETHQQVFQGLEHCSGDVVWKPPGEKEEKRRYDVIVVDLQSPGIQFRYVIAKGLDKNHPENLRSCNADYEKECQDVNRGSKNLGGPGCTACYEFVFRKNDYFPVFPLEEATKRLPDTAVVIDSDYGARTLASSAFRDHGPEGFTVVDGHRLDGPNTGDFDGEVRNPDYNNAVARPWLAISQSPPLNAMIDQIPEGKDYGGKYYDWVYTGVGGGPWIIKGGEVVGPWMKVRFKGKTYTVENVKELCDLTNEGSCYDGADQTSVGITQDGRWLFLAIVQKDTANLDFTTQLMNESIGAWNAIKFDGGGSSKLWYNKAVVQEDEVGRHLSQYLVVTAKPGNGIDIAPPGDGGDDETPPPSSIPWWKGIADWFTKRWEGIQDWWSGVQIWWEGARATWEGTLKWWEEFHRDPLGMVGRMLQDLLVKTLESWTRELCGAPAASAVTVVLGWLFWKKRKEHD